MSNKKLTNPELMSLVFVVILIGSFLFIGSDALVYFMWLVVGALTIQAVLSLIIFAKNFMKGFK